MRLEASIINHMSMLNIESMRHRLALMERFLLGYCQKSNIDWFLRGLYYMKKNCMKHGIMLCR